MTITNQDIDDAIRTSNTGTPADSPIRALTNALLKALNLELQNTQQDLINKVDMSVFNALAEVARSGSFTDLSDAPQSYGVKGQNTDGFMTQKAVTDALAGKADLVGGKVKLDQLPSGIVSGVIFKGLWNADTNRDNTNSPLPSTPVSDGDYYIVSVAGAQFGFTFAAGDWLIADNGAWAQLEPDDLVASVNGQTGTVTIDVGVTSIGVNVPTGLQVSGTPITSAGVIDITLASGYVIPTVEQLQNLGGIDAPVGWQEAGNESKYLAGDGALKDLPSDTQSDWSQTNSNAPDFIKNKPALFDGNYDSLSNKPSIPSKTSNLTNDSNFITSASLQGLVPKPVDWGDGDKFLAGDGTLKEVGGTTIKGVWQPTVTGTPALAKMQREGAVYYEMSDNLIDEVVFTDNSISTSASGEGGLAITSTPFDISNSSEDRFVICTKYEGSETPNVIYYGSVAGLGTVINVDDTAVPLALSSTLRYIHDDGLAIEDEYEVVNVLYADWDVHTDSVAQVIDFDKGVVELWTSRNGGTKELEWSFAELEQRIHDALGASITIDKNLVTHAILNTYFPIQVDEDNWRLAKSGKMSAAKTFEVSPSAIDVFVNTQIIDLTPPENAANNAFILDVEEPVYIPELDKELESGDIVFFDGDSVPFRYIPMGIESGDTVETLIWMGI